MLTSFFSWKPESLVTANQTCIILMKSFSSIKVAGGGGEAEWTDKTHFCLLYRIGLLVLSPWIIIKSSWIKKKNSDAQKSFTGLDVQIYLDRGGNDSYNIV